MLFRRLPFLHVAHMAPVNDQTVCGIHADAAFAIEPVGSPAVATLAD